MCQPGILLLMSTLQASSNVVRNLVLWLHLLKKVCSIFLRLLCLKVSCKLLCSCWTLVLCPLVPWKKQAQLCACSSSADVHGTVCSLACIKPACLLLDVSFFILLSSSSPSWKAAYLANRNHAQDVEAGIFLLPPDCALRSLLTDVNTFLRNSRQQAYRERERERESCGVRIWTMLLLSRDDDADVGEKAAAANHNV